MWWCVTLIALTGGLLNARKSRWGFACWTVSNTAFGCLNAYNGDWPQATVFGVFLGMSIYGWFKWKEKP